MLIQANKQDIHLKKSKKYIIFLVCPSDKPIYTLASEVFSLEA